MYYFSYRYVVNNPVVTLIYLLIHRTPVLLWSNPRMLLEHAREMLRIFEAQLVGDFTHRLICIKE